MCDLNKDLILDINSIFHDKIVSFFLNENKLFLISKEENKKIEFIFPKDAFNYFSFYGYKFYSKGKIKGELLFGKSLDSYLIKEYEFISIYYSYNEFLLTLSSYKKKINIKILY